MAKEREKKCSISNNYGCGLHNLNEGKKWICGCKGLRKMAQLVEREKYSAILY